MTSCWPTPEQWKGSEIEVKVPTLKADQTCIAGDIRLVDERLAAVETHLAEWEEVLSHAMRFANNCARA